MVSRSLEGINLHWLRIWLNQFNSKKNQGNAIYNTISASSLVGAFRTGSYLEKKIVGYGGDALANRLSHSGFASHKYETCLFFFFAAVRNHVSVRFLYFAP